MAVLVTTSASRARYLLIACVLVASVQSFAHAILVDSTPAAGVTIAGPELAIKLTFNVRVDAARSRVQLLSPDGKMATLAVKAGSTLNLLQARATGLVPGEYKLIWQVLASDGHITRGEVPFRVS